MAGALNLLWFVAGHLSAGVLALWLNQKWKLGGVQENPFYKDGYTDGYREAEAVHGKIQRELERQVGLCCQRLDACEAAQKERGDAG